MVGAMIIGLVLQVSTTLQFWNNNYYYAMSDNIFLHAATTFYNKNVMDGGVGLPKEIIRWNFPPSSNTTHFCVPWDHVNTDDWWTHHPEWNVAEENATVTCFQKDHPDSSVWQRLYDNQFSSSACDRTYTRQMWSSGYGTDMEQIMLGLQESLEQKVPMTVTVGDKWWHYSANKHDGSNATCSSKDMNCYFLPLSNCTLPGTKIDSNPIVLKRKHISNYDAAWKFASRPQQWLRKAIYEMKLPIQRQLLPPASTSKSSCAVLHVRRADVVLHHDFARKYFPVSDYVNLLPDQNQTLFLLTDDANAIDEAMEFFPDHNWVYFRRKRHRGTEGGWEEQVPSKNPKLEMITILATLDLVRHCDTLVHSQSKFSNLLRKSMPSNVTVYQVDKNVTVLYHANHSRSAQELMDLLERKRKEKKSQGF